MKRTLIGMAAAMSLFATGAMAADLAAKPYVKAPVMVDPAFNWSGFYIGGNVGYSWGRERDDGSLTGTQSVQVFRTAGPTTSRTATRPTTSWPPPRSCTARRSTIR